MDDVKIEPNACEKQLKCKKYGKDAYIHTPAGVAVCDSRGKKRIGKNGKTIVRIAERVVCDDGEYIVKAITENKVILTRV